MSAAVKIVVAGAVIGTGVFLYLRSQKQAAIDDIWYARADPILANPGMYSDEQVKAVSAELEEAGGLDEADDLWGRYSAAKYSRPGG